MSVQDERKHIESCGNGTWGTSCQRCKQVIVGGRSSYHTKGYCLRYSYEEYLNLMNEYPAKEYTKEEMEKLLNKNQESNKKFSQEYLGSWTEPVHSHPVFGSAEYIPEILQIQKDIIYSTIQSLRLGLEYSHEVLADYDQKFGRSRPRNQREAEQIEEHIAQIEKSLKELKELT